MKFNDVIRNVNKINNLKKSAQAYVVDSRRVKDKEELVVLLEKTSKQYFDISNVNKSINELKIHSNRNVRTLYSLFLKTILLEKPDFAEESRIVNDRIRVIEQEIINDSEKVDFGPKNSRHNQLDLFEFILDKAWKHQNSISIDEKNLILAIQEKLGISDREYMIIETRLNRFPKEKRALHTSEDFDEVRRELLVRGLLFEIRDDEGIDIDIIPEEIALALRQIWGLELREENYVQLLKSKFVKSKDYLVGIIERSGIQFDFSRTTLKDINQFILNSIKPSQLIGGFSPRDGLNNSDLNEWLKSLNLSSSGGKEDKILKLIEYYDNLNMIVESEEDERAKYFHYYEAIATRNIELLRKDGIIKKDLEIERLFEKATNYAFEVMLRHIPQKTVGNERPDGVLLFKDSIIMWDNKSKERPVNLKDHIKQFEGYVARSEKPVIAFIVIGPSFTDESLDVAERFSLTNDTFLSLITAKQFKDLCERWSSRPEKEVFPLNYFRKSGFFNPRIVKF
jgi:hypothetical protein